MNMKVDVSAVSEYLASLALVGPSGRDVGLFNIVFAHQLGRRGEGGLPDVTLRFKPVKKYFSATT